MLSTELHQERVPQLFAEFGALIGEESWLSAAARMASAAARWPYLRDYLQSQYRVVLQLCECSMAAAANGGRLPWALTDGALAIETFVFASQVIDLVRAARRTSNKRANILIARVREAFREPRMLHAMQLEAQVATHFLIRGYRVTFPELGSGAEKYDLLVEDASPAGLELEAKVVTRDKGRKIHLVESRHVLSPLLSSPVMLTCASQLRRGLAVRITVPNRLPKDLEAFRISIARQILSGRSGSLADGTTVRLMDFDVDDLGALTQPPAQETINFIEKLTGSRNSHRAIYRSEGATGVLVLTLDSAEADSMLHETFATFAESAGRQLTGKRPGAFIASFEGIGANALLDLAQSEGAQGNHSALAWRASEFLERSEFPHIVGVGFLSEPDYGSAEAALGGVSYWIPKPVSPFWDPAFRALFNKITGPRSVRSRSNPGSSPQ